MKYQCQVCGDYGTYYEIMELPRWIQIEVELPELVCRTCWEKGHDIYSNADLCVGHA